MRNLVKNIMLVLWLHTESKDRTPGTKSTLNRNTLVVLWAEFRIISYFPGKRSLSKSFQVEIGNLSYLIDNECGKCFPYIKVEIYELQ
jgi:hypothetical protein